MKINILSLFDGISCGQIALRKLEREREREIINNYYSSEIKQSAIKVTQYHFPNTIQIGDVTKVHYNDGILYTENGNFNVGKIDLLIGGSPCQDFSFANQYTTNETYGLKGNKSSLFYEYLRLKNETNPTYFLLENVRMKENSEKQLNKYMGINGIHINSNLVSYQNRHRVYWTNIPNVSIPKDKHINFQDYKDTDYEYCKQFKLKKTPSRIRMWNNGIKTDISSCENITYANKIGCLTRKQDRCPNSGLIEFEDFCRFLTRKEIEQAQTLPIGYTDMLSYNQMQDVCGDGWTVDVIAHILSNLFDIYN